MHRITEPKGTAIKTTKCAKCEAMTIHKCLDKIITD